jgi:hypothetical protein
VLAKELQSCGVAVVSLHPGRVMVERSPIRLRQGGYDDPAPTDPTPAQPWTWSKPKRPLMHRLPWVME